MKKIAFLALAIAFYTSATAQTDKSKRPSPPEVVTTTIESGAVVVLDYSKPSVKGRTIGTDLEPKPGQVWRTGANEATVFEVDKDVMIEGKKLPKGKYGLFTLVDGNKWTFIFNKVWEQWGSTKYNVKEDALRVTVKADKAADFHEQMGFAIAKNGVVTLMWGATDVSFKVK